jgi:hypothetical protein
MFMSAVVGVHVVMPASSDITGCLRHRTFGACHRSRHCAPKGEQHGHQDQDEDAQSLHSAELSTLPS